MESESGAVVGIVMGSDSDVGVMRAAAEVLGRLAVPYEFDVVSAHRTPKRMVEYAESAAGRGLEVLIAGAGGAAHLPGMVASLTDLPVIGVPISATGLAGVDALLSIAQMPAGIPVATMAVDNAHNAGLLAARIVGVKDRAVRSRVTAYREGLAEAVAEKARRVASLDLPGRAPRRD